jgi:16S rRNA (adenine1518-N6/adenine1519-N6)-dimethyltransferase
LDCDEKLFTSVVKTAFNQRRKTLRNALKSMLQNVDSSPDIFNKRPEQLTVEEFIGVTRLIQHQSF